MTCIVSRKGLIMIRLAATNEIGIPFEKAAGLKCICEGSQELELRKASNEMKVGIKSLGGIVESLFAGNIDEADADVGAYVVTEENLKPYGAICLFFDGVMETIHSKIGNFYALPSSVHEWIVLPRNISDLDILRTMVREINATVLIPREKLSDDVYEYVDGVFRIARR